LRAYGPTRASSFGRVAKAPGSGSVTDLVADGKAGLGQIVNNGPSVNPHRCDRCTGRGGLDQKRHHRRPNATLQQITGDDAQLPRVLLNLATRGSGDPDLQRLCLRMQV